jgi:hypothetical protein
MGVDVANEPAAECERRHQQKSPRRREQQADGSLHATAGTSGGRYIAHLAVVNDERVPKGEEEQQAAEQQAAHSDAEVAATQLSLPHQRASAHGDTHRIAVDRKDSNDESAAAALVTARSKHTNVPATPIPCSSVSSSTLCQCAAGCTVMTPCV